MWPPWTGWPWGTRVSTLRKMCIRDRDVAAAALARGLLVNAVRPDAVRVAPPLLVDDGEIDRALAILGGVMTEVMAGTGD